MLSVMLKHVMTSAPVVCRYFSSHTKPWDLFPAKTFVAKPEAPQYMMNMRDNLEFALERMRLTEVAVAESQCPSTQEGEPWQATMLALSQKVKTSRSQVESDDVQS